MNRRGFLKSILAAGVAPYVVTTAGVLMPVRQIAVPDLYVYGMAPGLATYNDIIDLLTQTNKILADMPWVSGNLPNGHRVTVRTGLPTTAWRALA